MVNDEQQAKSSIRKNFVIGTQTSVDPTGLTEDQTLAPEKYKTDLAIIIVNYNTSKVLGIAYNRFFPTSVIFAGRFMWWIMVPGMIA